MPHRNRLFAKLIQYRTHPQRTTIMRARFRMGGELQATQSVAQVQEAAGLVQTPVVRCPSAHGSNSEHLGVGSPPPKLPHRYKPHSLRRARHTGERSRCRGTETPEHPDVLLACYACTHVCPARPYSTLSISPCTE